MMRKFLMVVTVIGLALLVVLTPRFIGTERSIAAVPQLFIDHVDNQTKVFVRGVGSYMYPNITIRLTYEGQHGTVESVSTDNYTYFLSHSVADAETTRLDVNVTVYVKLTEYGYNCSVSIVPNEEDPSTKVMLVLEKDGDLVTRREGTSYRKVLERIE